MLFLFFEGFSKHNDAKKTVIIILWMLIFDIKHHKTIIFRQVSFFVTKYLNLKITRNIHFKVTFSLLTFSQSDRILFVLRRHDINDFIIKESE